MHVLLLIAINLRTKFEVATSKRLVNLSTYRRYTNNFIYLSIYLLQRYAEPQNLKWSRGLDHFNLEVVRHHKANT